MNYLLVIVYFAVLSLQIRNVELNVLNKFCESQEKVCQPQKHIACLSFKEKNPKVKIMMEVQLYLTSIAKIVHHFNQLKDNYARGYNARAQRPWGNRNISNMRGLSWDNELAIIALKSFLNGYGNNNQSFCYTYVTNTTRQMFNLVEISSWMLFQNKINDETFPSLLKGLTHQFKNKLLYDVTTNRFGCAGGVYVENNKQIKIKLKCMFNQKSVKYSLTKIGTVCGDCEDWGERVFCNQHYSGLCGETKIPAKISDAQYMSDILSSIAFPQTSNATEEGFIEKFFNRVTRYTTSVQKNTSYYLLAYGLFLVIISSVLACIWKCRENPMFCLCKTVICCARKKLSKSEDTKGM